MRCSLCRKQGNLKRNRRALAGQGSQSVSVSGTSAPYRAMADGCFLEHPDRRMRRLDVRKRIQLQYQRLLFISPLFNGVLKCGVGILNSLVGGWRYKTIGSAGNDTRPIAPGRGAVYGGELVECMQYRSCNSVFFLSVCFLLINSLNLPLHQALLTTNKANLPVGELMGLFNAFRSIGQVAGSMVSGFSYTVGHALPFFCASAFFMMMVFI